MQCTLVQSFMLSSSKAQFLHKSAALIQHGSKQKMFRMLCIQSTFLLVFLCPGPALTQIKQSLLQHPIQIHQPLLHTYSKSLVCKTWTHPCIHKSLSLLSTLKLKHFEGILAASVYKLTSAWFTVARVWQPKLIMEYTLTYKDHPISWTVKDTIS